MGLVLVLLLRSAALIFVFEHGLGGAKMVLFTSSMNTPYFQKHGCAALAAA